jgi:hypothetical protein
MRFSTRTFEIIGLNFVHSVCDFQAASRAARVLISDAKKGAENVRTP